MFKPNSTWRVWTTVYCMCICPKWTTNSTRTVYEQYTVPAQQHTVQEPTAHCWVLCLARNTNSIRTVYYSKPTAHCSNINSTLFMPLAAAIINSIRIVYCSSRTTHCLSSNNILFTYLPLIKTQQYTNSMRNSILFVQR